MKYYKYSQYLYLVAAIVFVIFGTMNFFKNDDKYQIQAIIAVGFIIMYFVRRSFLKKMENNQENK